MSSVLRSNKGQSLVLFVVFVPLIIMLGTYVVDMSYARYNENKIDSINKEVVKYGLKHIDEDPKDNMIKLIYQNDSDIDNYKIDIDLEKREVKVQIEKSSKGIFGSIIGKAVYREKSNYIGYIKDDKQIIERNENNEN